jgi:hypothetical protein
VPKEGRSKPFNLANVNPGTTLKGLSSKPPKENQSSATKKPSSQAALPDSFRATAASNTLVSGALPKRSMKTSDGTQEVVGAGLRGFVDSVRGSDAKTNPVKIQLTGFGAFEGVSDNPTGAFVSDGKNIDASMREGFGRSVTLPGTSMTTSGGMALEYTVTDAKRKKTFAVQVLAQKLEVNDSAIDGKKNSVQGLMRDFQPHAALSLGVDPGAREFEMVVRADLGGLTRSADGSLRHDNSKPSTGKESKEGELFNDALGRAIASGDKARRQESAATRVRS